MFIIIRSFSCDAGRTVTINSRPCLHQFPTKLQSFLTKQEMRGCCSLFYINHSIAWRLFFILLALGFIFLKFLITELAKSLFCFRRVSVVPDICHFPSRPKFQAIMTAKLSKIAFCNRGIGAIRKFAVATFFNASKLFLDNNSSSLSSQYDGGKIIDRKWGQKGRIFNGSESFFGIISE